MWQSLLCLVLSSCSQYDTDVLRGREIHVTSYLSAPYLTRKAEAAADGVHYEGFMVDLLAAMADILGCRFVIKEVADGRYGVAKEGGVTAMPGGRGGRLQADWNGMIGEVMRGEADLAVADLTVTPMRSLAVDFSQPILENGLVAVAGRQVASRSVEELADRDDLTFLVTEGGATSKFFQNTADPVLKKISSKISYVRNTKEGLEKAATQPDHVVVVESSQAEYTVNRDCRLKIIGEPINSASYAIAMAKGGALRDGDRTYDYLSLINYAILKLKYSGQLAKIQHKWWAHASACPPTS